MKRRIFLLSLLAAGHAQAHSARLGNIAIGHAWAKPSTDDRLQIFVPLINKGTEDDALIAIQSSTATSATLQPNATAFILKPNAPFPMRANGPHLELTGLPKPLLNGDRLELQLTFQKAGTLSLTVHIEESAGN